MTLIKWKIDRIASWQNDNNEMASWQNAKLAKRQVDKMVSWQNGKLAKRQDGKMVSAKMTG